jgi:hypothetical protein
LIAVRSHEWLARSLDELLDSDSSLPQNACKRANLQLAMNRNHATTAIIVSEHDMTTTLSDRTKTHRPENANRL